ncbi:MAG: DUF488 domain-containing protein [Alphaproteobacteria bacterium]|nr:DUF488 domain-containing protein [Alphaproteobacteria bacterium]
MKIHTIGFSGKKQDEFFAILNAAGITKLLDIRLYRIARFVPWASGANLSAECSNHGIEYLVIPELTPTKELLSAYKNNEIDWLGYEQTFNNLLATRNIEKLFTLESLDSACFLCSEKLADMCHRSLVVEYLQKYFPNMEIVHL